MEHTDEEELESFIEALRRVKERNPSFRIGQAIVNAVNVDCADLFYMSDLDVVKRTEKLAEGIYSPVANAHLNSKLRDAKQFERNKCASMVGHFPEDELADAMLGPEEKERKEHLQKIKKTLEEKGIKI